MPKSVPPIPLHHAIIAERARCFRPHMQSEEAALWRLIRGKRLGARFVRQYVIGSFIVDFAAPAVRLAVEVDGGYHALRAAVDARRDGKLARWGWRVLRLDARLVVAQPATAVARIRAALGQSPISP